MNKKRVMKIMGIFLLCLCLCLVIISYIYYISSVKANPDFCQQQLSQPQVNKDFFAFIDQRSEKANSPFLWKNMENQDEFFRLDFAKKIKQKPTYYLSDALKVIAYPQYDNNQKMYAIFLMRYLPVKHYMCVMDVSNMAYEQGIIKDKEVLRTALSPDSYRGIISYFWWLPDWQQRFKKHADSLYSKEYIEDVLNGGQAYLFPPKS